MTALDAAPAPVAPSTAGAPGRAVTRLTVRQVRRGALAVGVLAAGMSALVAATHAEVVASPEQAASLASLATNPAIRTLFGEPGDLGDPGGFTVWRTGIFLSVLLGAWCLLAATRITRGEEESGRTELLLAGLVTPRHLLARQLTILSLAAAATGAAVSVALSAAGTDRPGALVHGAGLGLTGVFFAATGLLAAQIFPARSAATGSATAVLAAGLMVRMIGDGVAALGWLRWLTPFGLTGLTRPYDTNRWLPLMVLAAMTAAVLAAAVAANRRDVRGGWLAPRAGRAPRTTLLGSAPAFALRRMLRPLSGWAAGIAAYYLLIGLIAASMISFLADNPELADLAGQAGFGSLGAVEGYAATLFALLAMPASGFATTRLTAFFADENSGRLTLLCAAPRTRQKLAGIEVATAAAGTLVLALVAALATWAGTTISGAPLSLTAAVAGALNVLPIAALGLGASALALGVAPRAIGWFGALPVVGGFLLLVIADSVRAPVWVTGLSPYAHIALVPLESPDWVAAAVMTSIAACAGAAGLAAYARRDLRL
ncbi:hypothetical protein JIG36_27990 [Actinoplanes sp. LDG1-06]|uniref:Polyketide antibiotic transporter n=1 Tax=Paractinoplanes ovalisporus TaxID=2810368 RepID=A0ABS2AI04_9ACTN|nr:hypothetical protein [Actinoplanes ovalisporus]MBM2619400.1 hypothetical protein [Actinoplanes ovalisporus]